MNLHIVQDTVFINDFADLLTEMGEIKNHHFFVYYSESKTKGEYKYLIKNKFKESKILDSDLESLHIECRKYKNVYVHLLSDMLLDFVEKLDEKTNLVWCTWGSDFYCPDELFAKYVLDKESYKYYLEDLNKKLISTIEVHKIPLSYRFPYDFAREKYRHGLRVKKVLATNNTQWENYLTRKRELLTKVKHLANYGKDDYAFIKEHYGISHPYLPFFYTCFDEKDDKVGESVYIEKSGIKNKRKIFIGNCGTIHNNHLELIPVLKRIRQTYPDVCFMFPLSYGDKKYIEFISGNLKDELKESFFPIYDFIEKQEYYRMLNSIDIMVMNHNINQGGTNLFKAIYYGKKVFIKNKNPLGRYLKENGVQLLDVENDFDIRNLFEPLADSIIKQNKLAINSVFSKEKAAKGFRHIMEAVSN